MQDGIKEEIHLLAPLLELCIVCHCSLASVVDVMVRRRGSA
jgi:hypothetical protein